MTMFCRQCEQTAAGKGCTVKGVCGKEETVAKLQDLLIYTLQGIGFWSDLSGSLDVKDPETDRFMKEALFSTITNVNFDTERVSLLVQKAVEIREKAKKLAQDAYRSKNGKEYDGNVPDAAKIEYAATTDGLIEQAEAAGILNSLSQNEDARSLKELLLYGLKGMAAYADHAAVLGKVDDEVDGFFHKGLAAVANSEIEAEALVGLVMECGKTNLACMKLLDQANTEAYGHPEPAKVSTGHLKGPAILVSGHDLKDLKMLLEQTKDTGVNVYTHGEMLPAHGYPELRKHSHLAGHFGTAWQNQQKEFPEFPGSILFTTNCIQKPLEEYKDKVFTTGLVAWPGLRHIEADSSGNKDFSPLIEKALGLGGFEKDETGKNMITGFARNAILGAAETVIKAVKEGAIKRFFLIGGCDGAKPGRNYYTEFAEKVPQDCVIITLACGKFRFNNLEFGEIGGIPRILDCGQCNDAYSAIVVASALAEAFDCTVNELPLSFILSWYEQKAVCILLTLLYLGIKNIRLGPSLPAFVTPNILKVLVDKFEIKPISSVDDDLRGILEN